MLRERIARIIFCLAILALPLTYGVKDILGSPNITWIDPTMIFGLFLFLLVGWRLRTKCGWFLIVLAFVSAVFGWYLHRVEPGHGHSSWFVVTTDPISLTLNLIWFWVCIVYFIREPLYTAWCLSLSVICQFLLASYLYLAAFGLIAAPESVELFLHDYRSRQVLWLSSGGIARMGGTFNESPPFGLFMLSCLVVLGLELRRNRGSRSRLVWAGAAFAVIGTLCSFSDQTLISMSLLGLALGWDWLKRPSFLRKLVAVPVILIVCFTITRIYAKRAVETNDSISVYGTSLGEREFNARYALTIFAKFPVALFFGIGPNRFGDYASENGMYERESTVQPQIALIEWVVGYGFIGLLAISGWLYQIAKRAWRGFGNIGLIVIFALIMGDMFQARWLWEAWFMALAYLYASGAREFLVRPRMVPR